MISPSLNGRTGEAAIVAPRKPRYRSLDLWRGLACLMVVALHTSFYVKADVTAQDRLRDPVGTRIISVVGRLGAGVYMFFVISGYCIAATADATRRKGHPAADYFRRRLRRIFPPYWVMLLLTAGVAWLVIGSGGGFLLLDRDPIPHPASLNWQQWLGNITLTETWRYHFMSAPRELQLGPSWTLCYEEQFYAVCGVLLLVAPRRLFAGTAVVTLAVLGTTALAMIRPDLPIAGFFFDGRWLLFAAGVAVYCQVNYAAPPRRWWIPLFLTAALAAAVVLRYVVLRRIGTWEQKDQMFEIVAALAFALLLLVLHRSDDRIADSRWLRPIALCGTMCYSLYLVHWPVVKLISHTLYLSGVRGIWPSLLVTFPLAMAASIGVAAVFYRVVERRFLNTSPSPVMRRAAEPAAVGVSV